MDPEVENMAQPQVIEGTPEQLTKQLAQLPSSKRYRLIEIVEGQTEPTDEEIAAADAALEQTIISPGYATGTDNTRIDADLAREYVDSHADLYRKGPK
jgi:hypothetical protein